MEYTIANLRRLPRLVAAVAPQRYNPDRLTISKCSEVVSASQVRVRGWYFPHIDRDGTTSGPRGKYVLHETEALGYHLEQWRMHRSGQFLLRLMPWEVPNDEVQIRMRANARGWESRRSVDGVTGFLSFVMLIYSIAETFSFAARLAQAAHYDTAVDVQVGLRGVHDWALGSSDFGIDLSGAYIARHDGLMYSVTLPLDTLIAAPLNAAVVATQSLFEQFGWYANPATISNWQRQIFKP